VVVVESREAAMHESGEIMHSGVQIYAELGELLAGKKPKPHGQTTVFKSLGIAVEDIASAELVYRRATAGQRGAA
jgi:ornithine cyclodeaminase/alanine dehydrogenase-like protein (mu-crystallin family)